MVPNPSCENITAAAATTIVRLINRFELGGKSSSSPNVYIIIRYFKRETEKIDITSIGELHSHYL
jgi:hypothetical protein